MPTDRHNGQTSEDRSLNTGRGQAMLETAIILPALLLLFLGMIYFNMRSYNQAKAAVAARHMCWLGAHGQFNSIPTVMTNFFVTNSPSYSVDVKHEYEDVDLGPSWVSDLMFIFKLFGVEYNNNPKVTVTYNQKAYQYGVIVPAGTASTNEDVSLAFLWTNSPNVSLVAARCDADAWNKATWEEKIAVAAYVGWPLPFSP
ncbi:MAG: hypothetical protein EOM12_05690 [Verrucomicrobiae bacterium]|nr:hypothetical protein [Verrucomicrobiae bacterium]